MSFYDILCQCRQIRKKSDRISNPASVSISILCFSAWKVKVLCPKVASLPPTIVSFVPGGSRIWCGYLDPQLDLSVSQCQWMSMVFPLSTFRGGAFGPWHVPRLFHHSELEGSAFRRKQPAAYMSHLVVLMNFDGFLRLGCDVVWDMMGLWWQQRTGKKRNS